VETVDHNTYLPSLFFPPCVQQPRLWVRISFTKGEVFLLPLAKGGGEGFKEVIYYLRIEGNSLFQSRCHHSPSLPVHNKTFHPLEPLTQSVSLFSPQYKNRGG